MIVGQTSIYSLNDRDPKLPIISIPASDNLRPLQVAAEVGSSFITEAAQKRRPDNVSLLPVKDLDCELKLTVVWRKNDNNPALKQFLALLASKG